MMAMVTKTIYSPVCYGVSGLGALIPSMCSSLDMHCFLSFSSKCHHSEKLAKALLPPRTLSKSI